MKKLLKTLLLLTILSISNSSYGFINEDDPCGLKSVQRHLDENQRQVDRALDVSRQQSQAFLMNNMVNSMDSNRYTQAGLENKRRRERNYEYQNDYNHRRY